MRRKVEVLDEISAGLSEAEACATHNLSTEELGEWKRRVATDGVKALRTTRTQSLGRATIRRKRKNGRSPAGIPTAMAKKPTS